jgi:predicted Zn-dependent protease
MQFALRRLGFVLACCAFAIAGGLIAGRLGGLIGAALGGGLAFWAWLILPRTAHAAFEAGRYPLASRRYRVLGALAGSQRRARASLLSRAACRVAVGDVVAAEALLADLDIQSLEVAERAVWLNNRACAQLAGGGDPIAALAFVDEAAALRPDVPSVQHTRGRALLESGRVDDAIAVLDHMRAGGELPPRLEAERCRDLAKAWAQKGQAAYADDYRQRADAMSR